MLTAIICIAAIVGLAYWLIKRGENDSALLDGPPIVGAAQGSAIPVEMPDLTPIEETTDEELPPPVPPSGMSSSEAAAADFEARQARPKNADRPLYSLTKKASKTNR